jgi:hypothetical protein
MAEYRTALYRFFNKKGELIYVGISVDPLSRWMTHATYKAWWSEVTEKTTEWYDTTPLAADAERIVIRRDRPKYNKRGKPRH